MSCVMKSQERSVNIIHEGCMSANQWKNGCIWLLNGEKLPMIIRTMPTQMAAWTTMMNCEISQRNNMI